MNKKQIETLKNTNDDDLLSVFPDYKRALLRRVKREVLKKQLPKILIFDIETAPMEVYVWNCAEQRIHIGQIIKDWFILSWSAKWLFKKEVMHDVVTPREVKVENDKRIVKHLWNLLDKADILIAHNLISFDRKKVNTRFLKYGLGHPSPYQTIDTLRVARKEFKVSSNKLDYLCQFLGLDVKLPTGFDLWKQCLKGDEKALGRMDRYCRNDIKILEELYLKLRPYIHSHPNCALYMETDKPVCPNCGSSKLHWGYKYSTLNNQYKAGRCDCGAFVRMLANGSRARSTAR